MTTEFCMCTEPRQTGRRRVCAKCGRVIYKSNEPKVVHYSCAVLLLIALFVLAAYMQQNYGVTP